MKLVIKGDLSILSQYAAIQGVYAVLERGLQELEKATLLGDKKEIVFRVPVPALFGYEIKMVKNEKTKTITVIIK